MLMDAGTYFKETESAVRHLFMGLSDYAGKLMDIRPRVFAAEGSPDTPSNQALYADWLIENRNAIQENREKAKAYLGLTFSIATLSGAILQVAHMGINLFSCEDYSKDMRALSILFATSSSFPPTS